ncbi:MAG: 4Fe-4S dicluster domain-containing protein [Verrucomicrobia bacterium]|nr:4Fe-4S dicluster domain-containing protein [Verrucomicrobiota bacterium]NBU10812.1 4Fe-4S dicluster domain-containing protein [Pseudomonadota bacterium]NDA66571.1 4Fe-4S dicluster domain-containing protein [Verrucomicrobiota bacterium]NDB75375.1 4Fe-4S dicluster domain-containing protein [Verrucomicrobiota bacterium]NDD38460.1 4Fe-4S dicluster domain-containing protein [Verrucomicrobiota bacterium]
MKFIPPVCPEPETGPQYFRSPEALADAPELREWAEREFPAGASELTSAESRRDFMKLMSASFMLAGFGLTGCRRPTEHIYPFGKQPEGYIHGIAQHFATAMPTRTGAVALLAKSSDGRPTKVEANPLHPDQAGTDQFVQASVLGLYDPDRAQHFRNKGNIVKREAALDALTQLGKAAAANGGRGLAIIAESNNSPTRARLQAQLAAKLPNAVWANYDAVDSTIHAQAASLVTGKSVAPYFKFGQAKRVLSLDSDFLGGEDEASRYTRDFAKGRKISKPDAEKKDDLINRLYVVESLMTLTGGNADHRMRVAPSQVAAVAAQLAAEVLKISGSSASLNTAALAAGAKVDAKWITECAKDLVAHKGTTLVVAGQRQPLVVHVLAHAMNEVLGAFGKTIELHEAPAAAKPLAAAIGAETVVVLGANPAYTASETWSQIANGAKTIVRLGYHEDETATGATWHVPAAHYLESWGDARTSDGTVVAIQPLIAPLFGGLTESEVLGLLLGNPAANAHTLTRETFASLTGGALDEEKWKKFLHDGFLAGTKAQVVSAAFNWSAAAGAVASAAAPSAPSKDKLEVVFHRDYSVDDGRYTNNGWLQELPDPVTKIVWDNAVLISRATAEQLALKNGDVIAISANGRVVEGGIWIQPGMADFTLGLALGYGRKWGRVASFEGGVVGFNAYPIRPVSAGFVTGATAKATGRTHSFICTQDHWTLHGRPVVREANVDQYQAKPDFAKNFDLDAHTDFLVKNPDGTIKNIYEHPYKTNPGLVSKTHQWGMVVDLNACTGCSACVIACQSENNIPIVGKDQVAKGREMHWMRIDRYYAADPKKKQQGGMIDAFLSNATGSQGNPDTVNLVERDELQATKKWIDDPQMLTQPMMCQHCENAPCESVCPVNATAHDDEGLNVMAYNRCVGTRYCANNCAWKVRRFNFFDFNKRPIGGGKMADTFFKTDIGLYKGPLGHRPGDEIDLVTMARNPDVTVRMRGVMEKCTFCQQRIEGSKIAQKVRAGASNDVQVKDGAIKTACQQVCPAGAITFGNVLDPNSAVSKLKQQDRNYTVLGFLDNRPRTTYLARVRNVNPAMPDAKIWSLEEYKSISHSDPMQGHGHAPAAESKGAKH